MTPIEWVPRGAFIRGELPGGSLFFAPGSPSTLTYCECGHTYIMLSATCPFVHETLFNSPTGRVYENFMTLLQLIPMTWIVVGVCVCWISMQSSRATTQQCSVRSSATHLPSGSGRKWLVILFQETVLCLIEIRHHVRTSCVDLVCRYRWAHFLVRWSFPPNGFLY